MKKILNQLIKESKILLYDSSLNKRIKLIEKKYDNGSCQYILITSENFSMYYLSFIEKFCKKNSLLYIVLVHTNALSTIEIVKK